MIQLSSRHLLVVDDAGDRTSYDLDQLYEDLKEAFAANGVTDRLLVEQIARAVEQQLLELGGAASADLQAREINRMVTRVLVNTGYPDVANCFRQQRQTDEIHDPEAVYRSWDDDRIGRIVGENLPLTPAARNRLQRTVAAKLNAIGLYAVTDAFIRYLEPLVGPMPEYIRLDTNKTA